ncbi:hypothetical protein AAFF_G00214060 [Aldrovandia affinis]|uniref:Uncharacterized protein n=1 Tax=Aldrovandia affinis TaxID=143900 RepID=A0AAD7RGF0_9TELE|nr:hypothetical protein AAFF_G00214060 [Aldrovandia affinis]
MLTLSGEPATAFNEDEAVQSAVAVAVMGQRAVRKEPRQGNRGNGGGWETDKEDTCLAPPQDTGNRTGVGPLPPVSPSPPFKFGRVAASASSFPLSAPRRRDVPSERAAEPSLRRLVRAIRRGAY